MIVLLGLTSRKAPVVAMSQSGGSRPAGAAPVANLTRGDARRHAGDCGHVSPWRRLDPSCSPSPKTLRSNILRNRSASDRSRDREHGAIPNRLESAILRGLRGGIELLTRQAVSCEPGLRVARKTDWWHDRRHG